jgi:hypothetical protein
MMFGAIHPMQDSVLAIRTKSLSVNIPTTLRFSTITTDPILWRSISVAIADTLSFGLPVTTCSVIISAALSRRNDAISTHLRNKS